MVGRWHWNACGTLAQLIGLPNKAQLQLITVQMGGHAVLYVPVPPRVSPGMVGRSSGGNFSVYQRSETRKGLNGDAEGGHPGSIRVYIAFLMKTTPTQCILF
jgi:hypothetical protein